MESTPGNPSIAEVNERLNDGLRTCRSVVANYKALLLPERPFSGADEAANDDDAAGALGEDQA